MSRQGATREEQHAAAARPMRPRELQDALNFHLYHPLAWRLAKLLARTPITPNVVSVAGGCLVVAAAFAYARPGWPLPALLGLALHMAWHVVDGADGDLARITGRAGPAGEIVDGICDYAGHIVLYLMLAMLLAAQIGPLAWGLAAAAGVSRILQANHFETQRRQYQWWVYATPWLRNARGEGSPPSGPGRLGVLGALGAAYLWLAGRLAPQTPRIERAIAAAGEDAARIEAVRSLIRTGMAGYLARIHWLGANQRTIALGVSMLAGSPLYYFIYEAVALNLVLAWSIRSWARAAGDISRQLDRLAVDSTCR